MIRILEVVGKMDRAGQETFLMNVLRKADRNKYQISFSVNTNYIGAYEEEIQKFNCKVYHNPYSVNIKNLNNYIKFFRKILTEEGPFDVVHCHTWLFGGFIMWAAKKEGVPVRIMHSHNTSDGYKNTLFRKIYQIIGKKLIHNNATCEVACGEDAYFSLFNKKCEDKSKILNNAVDVDEFDERNFDVIAYKKGLSLPEDAKVIVSVARFCDVKNHKKIISSFYQYHLNCPNAYLLLIGDGELKEQIVARVEELDIFQNVKFLGVRSDVNKLLMCSDVFIMPSKFEGLPVSLIEAQAAGVSCVISDTITNEVDMRLNLITKINIAAEDTIWADAIERVVCNEKPAFQTRKEKLTECGYSVESIWKKLEKIYVKDK